MPITDGPWMASAPHPQTGAITVVNPHGRVVAAMVPNEDDAAFICAAREAHHMDVTVPIDWKAFGRAVQAARKAARYSQSVAAEMCGISRNYVTYCQLKQTALPWRYPPQASIRAVWPGYDGPRQHGPDERLNICRST